MLRAFCGCDERRGCCVRAGEEDDMRALRAGSTYAEPDSQCCVKAKMSAGSLHTAIPSARSSGAAPLKSMSEELQIRP